MIFRQIKKLSIQALDSNRSVCMVVYAIEVRYQPFRNEQLPGNKSTGAQFQNVISKTEGLVRIYTARQMDMAKWTQLVTPTI